MTTSPPSDPSLSSLGSQLRRGEAVELNYEPIKASLPHDPAALLRLQTELRFALHHQPLLHLPHPEEEEEDDEDVGAAHLHDYLVREQLLQVDRRLSALPRCHSCSGFLTAANRCSFSRWMRHCSTAGAKTVGHGCFLVGMLPGGVVFTPLSFVAAVAVASISSERNRVEDAGRAMGLTLLIGQCLAGAVTYCAGAVVGAVAGAVAGAGSFVAVGICTACCERFDATRVPDTRSGVEWLFERMQG